MSRPDENRPNTLWPVGTHVEFVDAWGRNPVQARVIRHINQFEVLAEDARGVRHCGQTWRIATAPVPAGGFDDQFRDLLG